MKTELACFVVALACTNSVVAQTPSIAPRMKAIAYHSYGSPDLLRLEERETPVPNDEQVLIRVHAASVNPFDWHFMRGTPYIMRLGGAGLFEPKVTKLGVDYSGTIVAIGKSVSQFKIGDEVFGGATGAFAEYVCVRADGNLVLKPANMSFEQAASVPIAGVTALQALRDVGKVQAGQKVLINGASGGVGTFAVQIAKSFGADVTGVCSTRNLELVRSLGADHVIDYTQEAFTDGAERYDLIVDCVGNHALLDYKRVLEPDGTYVMIGGPSGRWIRPLNTAIEAMLLDRFVTQRMTMMMADITKAELTVLSELMQTGEVTPVIDRRYGLSETPEAIRYLEEGHARGKVIINLEGGTTAAPVAPQGKAGILDRLGPYLVVSAFIACFFGLPIVAALVLNRRLRRRSPGTRPFRWGYYYSIQSLVAGVCLGIVLESGLGFAIVFSLVYAILAWCFAQRRHWAWIALTLLSFNPIAWIINFFYLRKRWSEDLASARSVVF